MYRRVSALLVVAAAMLFATSTAHAARLNLLGFHFQSSHLYVHENAGVAQVTVTRTATIAAANVWYLTIPLMARPGIDFTVVHGVLDFAPGQASASFSIPVVDHRMPLPSRDLSVVLFGGWPIGLGLPAKANLTIRNDDRPPGLTSNPVNPLGLNPAPTNGNPLSGTRFYDDRIWSDPAVLAQRYARSHRDWSRALWVIADQPGVERFGEWDKPSAAVQASTFLLRAAYTHPGTIPLMSTYTIVQGQCRKHERSDSPAQVAFYHRWINNFAWGISSYRAVLFLEMDSLITVGCLSPAGVSTRMAELHYAIDTLTARCPRLVIYLDAGAADAYNAHAMARLLKRAGVAKIQGFFVNSTHFDWPLHEIRYGEQISRLTGGKHFVVSTGDSGQGPLVPANRGRDGNEVLCNPPGRGLGPKPTSNTGFPNVDAFAWIDAPGQSDGVCGPGQPPTPQYWPAYVMALVRNANYAVR